jgi:hypothetical protein
MMWRRSLRWRPFIPSEGRDSVVGGGRFNGW